MDLHEKIEEKFKGAKIELDNPEVKEFLNDIITTYKTLQEKNKGLIGKLEPATIKNPRKKKLTKTHNHVHNTALNHNNPQLSAFCYSRCSAGF